MANYPSLHTASFIFPTNLYLRERPATSAHQLMFSCATFRWAPLHLFLYFLRSQMSSVNAPSTSAAKAKAVVGRISAFLEECGNIKAVGRRQELYKTHNCLLFDGQCNGRKICLSFAAYTPSCDKQSAHLVICYGLCIIGINQKSHTLVPR